MYSKDEWDKMVAVVKLVDSTDDLDWIQSVMENT